ncbi:hypothetical protein GCM10020258_00850 [Sphingomonas yabuuchiae]
MAADTTDTTETGDAPLIDLNEASIKKLIARAKKRGYITYDQLNEALPQDQMSSDQLEDIMAALNEMGVNIVENEEQGEDGESEEEADDAETTDAESDGGPQPEAKKKETVDRTDDPVRMYLREMGAVELLSREGEIAIAKRIEAGRDTMILGLCESPITFNAIIDWSTALNEGTMQLREILDLDAMLSKDAGPENLGEEDEDDNGEISAKNAGPQFKEEEEPEDPRSMTRMARAANVAGPAPRTRKRTIPCPSPRWRRRSSLRRWRSSPTSPRSTRNSRRSSSSAWSPWRWAASCRRPRSASTTSCAKN